MNAQKLVAEVLGTAFLVCAVVGSGIMADRLTADTAVALLANTAATGAVLFVLITIFAPISGAQFNPVVTGLFVFRGEMALGLALAYMAAQIIGGVGGVWAAHAMFDLPILQLSQTLRTGPSQWLAEGVATFGLLLAILGSIHARANVGAVVAAYIMAAYWFTASTSFANPAVTLARSLTDTFAGIHAAHAPMFIMAQILGGTAAFVVGGGCFVRRSDKAQ